MAKFVIQCPKCGVYTEASTGIFAKKRFNCRACGHEIDTKTDSFSHVTCPHCHNEVSYDARKGVVVECPICRRAISTTGSGNQKKDMMVSFTCPTCSSDINANLSEVEHKCLLCGTVINIEQRLAQMKIKKDGAASLIKFDGDSDAFIWKHPVEDFNLGSQLIVHESQEAIFFRDGKALDLFGAGRYTLETHNLPILEEVYKLPVGSDEVFHSEVYFINKAVQMGLKWGTDSKVKYIDPAYDLHIELGASGSFNLCVTDARKALLKLVGTAGSLSVGQVSNQVNISRKNDGSIAILEITGKFKSLIMNAVKTNLVRVIKNNNISVFELDEHMDVISEEIRNIVNRGLDEYGFTMPEFYITTIVTPDDDPDFQRLKRQFAQRALNIREEKIKKDTAEAAYDRKMVEAKTEADLKRMSAQAEADAYMMKAQAEAAEMRAKGYTYQQETARQVSLEAMKNGIVGGGDGGNGGIVGDAMGLGLAMGVVNSVVGMTKDTFGNVVADANTMGQSVGSSMSAGWNCSCGKSGISTKFCPDCGKPMPEPAAEWKCPKCATERITSKFCPNCGEPKPEAVTWECTKCGTKDISSKFCPNCGAAKPEEAEGWDCSCGRKGIKTDFCPDCGKKKVTEE